MRKQIVEETVCTPPIVEKSIRSGRSERRPNKPLPSDAEPQRTTGSSDGRWIWQIRTALKLRKRIQPRRARTTDSSDRSTSFREISNQSADSPTRECGWQSTIEIWWKRLDNSSNNFNIQILESEEANVSKLGLGFRNSHIDRDRDRDR